MEMVKNLFRGWQKIGRSHDHWSSSYRRTLPNLPNLKQQETKLRRLPQKPRKTSEPLRALVVQTLIWLTVALCCRAAAQLVSIMLLTCYSLFSTSAPPCIGYYIALTYRSSWHCEQKIWRKNILNRKSSEALGDQGFMRDWCSQFFLVEILIKVMNCWLISGTIFLQSLLFIYISKGNTKRQKKI